jgi:hypothetical protein
VTMMKLPPAFHYWQSVPDKAAAAREQVGRYKPDDLMPTGHHAGQFIAALTPSEREQMAQWYRALAKASHDPVDAARYQAFANVMTDH